MNPRTAAAGQSIWQDLAEDTFRGHLVHLEERTNAVPIDTQLFPLPPDTQPQSHDLSLDDEQSLADSFAFLAAAEQGAQSVAAVCLEEAVDQGAITVRFAAVDTINSFLRESLDKFRLLLIEIAKTPESDGSDDCNQLQPLDSVFDSILELHNRRLIARLRSSKWEKPVYLSRTHKKALWQDFRNLVHRVQFLYTKKEKESRLAVESAIENLAKLYQEFETTPPENEFSHLSNLVRSTYQLCTSQLIRDYAHRLGSMGPTPQIRSAVKTLRQIEKIAAYYRVASTLVQVLRKYRRNFQSLEFTYLQPYSSIPTSIGYEAWAKTCHIHAEIQLIVYYDTHQNHCNQTSRPPRVIGTSKYLCYLCYLFIERHGRFPTTNTHGRLYDQWTVPDLREYSEPQREKYKQILQAVDEEIVKRGDEPPLWRLEPMTSRENLLGMADECGPTLD
ncbi:hypothetical protein H072_8257 [Dactylellina haptotyla CBS 200.50]|uniref:Uncharacterized protein n=1 Tax=Dactylellina haptotyla (strain CBS 200.50) TaxID=1284197 RepID=S8BFH1_DACHA|nr:hypothetical protein H072_8257 [Dactylellina haptotyla CBS 200.50]